MNITSINVPLNDQSIDIPLDSVESDLCQRSDSVAKRIIPELGLALLATALVISFAAVSFNAFILGAGLATAIGIASIEIGYKIYKKESLDDVSNTLDGVQHLTKASVVTTIGSAGLNVAIHESGHAVMALSCFKKANPHISMNPFGGGSTSYIIGHGLTDFGKIFGKDGARALCAAAGMMSSTLCALFEFGLAYQLKESNPALAECLTINGCMQIVQEVAYGITTFFVSHKDLGHDFIAMWKFGGIHPLIPIAMMVALPLFELAILKWLKSRDKSHLVQEFVCANLIAHK